MLRPPRGDVNQDEFVTPQDAEDLRMHVLGSTPAGYPFRLCSGIGQLECDLRDATVRLSWHPVTW
jgi:hypothetical protein